MAKTEIEIPGDPVQVHAKKKALESMAQHESQTLIKVADLLKNPKAIEYLTNPPFAVKALFGIK